MLECLAKCSMEFLKPKILNRQSRGSIRIGGIGGEICAKEYFENLDKIYAPDHLVNLDL